MSGGCRDGVPGGKGLDFMETLWISHPLRMAIDLQKGNPQEMGPKRLFSGVFSHLPSP